MVKIPVEYNAYDNGYQVPMGICLSIGGTALISGLVSGETGLLIIGVIGIVLFFIFKLLNAKTAKDEYEKKLLIDKKAVEKILYSNEMRDEEKYRDLVNLGRSGNKYAVAFLEYLKEVPSRNVDDFEVLD